MEPIIIQRTFEARSRSSDRRGTNRFDLTEPVTYRMLTGAEQMAGSGTTVNMGSGGLLFTTEQALPMGRKVEVSINWPALLDGKCALKLVAIGLVVRSDERCAAVQIDNYEFRTRSTRAN